MAPPTKHSTDVILDAARGIVLADGPRAASVAAIAQASGAPVGTLYHRFGNRDGVLAAAWLRALERFQQLVLAGVAPQLDPVERGVAVVSGAVEFSVRHPDDGQLLLAIRRDDLLDADPDDRLRARLAVMNAPMMAELRDIAQGLCGSADERAVEAVRRAVVDLPYAAIRRHSGGLPDWLGADVIATARVLLEAARSGARYRE